MDRVPLDSYLVSFLSHLLVAVSCFVIVRSFLSGLRISGTRPLPPSPPALPIIGNLHQLVHGHRHRTLQALAKRHGPLFLLHLGSVPTIVVSSASMAEEVLKTQDHAFCSRPQQFTARGILYDCQDVGFCPYGERWRKLRRIAVDQLLSTPRVNSFRRIREEEIASLIDQVRAASARDNNNNNNKRQGVNITKHILGLTYSVVSRAAFGNKLGGMAPQVMHEMFKEVFDLLQTIAVSDMFPRLGWVDRATGLDARTKRMASKLDGLLETALREHEKCWQDNDEDGDLLDDLLSVLKEDKDSSGFKLDRTDAKGLIADMFIAGTDTTFKLMEWAMAELVKNPKEMEKIQAEVRQIARAQGRILEEQLDSMSLLRAALKEALRLHPPAPLLIPHEVVQDTKLQGYDIPAKTRVIINAWAIGRDNELWESADEFRPERFMQSSFEYTVNDFRFIPFGAGRRGCPGVAFGTRLAELTLANMLYHFDWMLPDGQDLESFQVTESSGFSPGLNHALTLVATPLKQET